MNTAINTTIPVTTVSKYEDTLSSVMETEITPIKRPPTIVPVIPPFPPVIEVPPYTAAVTEGMPHSEPMLT